MTKIVGVLLTDTHLKESNLQINYSVFEQTAKYCVSKGINTVYHLGDVFDSRKAQTLIVLKEGFLNILDMLNSYGITLVVIPGNHDKTNYSSVDSFLHPFKHHPNLTLIDTYFNVKLTDTIKLHFLPYFSNVVYGEMLSSIAATNSKVDSVKDILFTHIGVDGARMNNGMIVEGIAKQDFNIFDKVYVGHYHDKHSIDDKFHYIGSSIQHNYGETTEKGITLLYEDLSFETLELEFPRYLKLEVDIDKLTPVEINEIKKEKENSNDNLRVVLIGSEEKIKSFNKQQLLEVGVSVEVKVEEVVKTEIDERVEPFTDKSIFEEFDVFCEKNNIQDKEVGKKYLQTALN